MHAYNTIKLTEWPDKHDVRVEGRTSKHGPLHQRVRGAKREMRRHLKRSDRARALAEELRLEAEADAAELRELRAEEARYVEECFCAPSEKDEWDAYRWRRSFDDRDDMFDVLDRWDD